MSAGADLLAVAALALAALAALALVAAIIWRRRARRKAPADAVSAEQPEASEPSDASTSTGPTIVSMAGAELPSANQYADFLAATPEFDEAVRPAAEPSAYGHVFDTMLGEGPSTSAAEPGTRALRSLAPGGASLVMTRGTHKVGRSRSNDLRLDDPSVSRVHAAFHAGEDGEYEVRDLQSLNGLFVNGRKRSRATLVPGDRVDLGDARLDYVATALGET